MKNSRSAATSQAALHIVEPGGRGGLYQHVLAFALEQASVKRRVVLHTARDPELIPAQDGVTVCGCMRWHRRGPRLFRRGITMAWALTRLCPHVFWTARRGSAWEVHGQFGSVVYLLLLAVVRARGGDVSFAPHNDFSRSGGKLRDVTRAAAERIASRVIVFNASAEGARRPGIETVRRNLSIYVPPGWEDWESYWQQRWGRMPVILFAGQLRLDKNPVALIEAVAGLESAHLLAFVGEDVDAKDQIELALARYGLDADIVDRYLELPQFAAAIAAATVIVCPYEIASQSAVLALAAALNTVTVASDVGGLAEQATITFPSGSREGLVDALKRALVVVPQPGP